MLKQESKEYRGFRAAGIRLNEEMLPQLASIMSGRTNILLPAIHDFDLAHVIMLVEQGLLSRPDGAAILRSFHKMEEEGVTKARIRVGGGLHSGEQYDTRTW